MIKIPDGPWCVDKGDSRAVRLAAAPGHKVLRTKATRMGSAEDLALVCSALPELLALHKEVLGLNPKCLSLGAGKMAYMTTLASIIEKKIEGGYQ